MPGYFVADGNVAQTSATAGNIWRANTWIPINYMVYHGLKDYGYGDIATLLAVRTQQLLDNAGDREYYTSESGSGVGLDPF